MSAQPREIHDEGLPVSNAPDKLVPMTTSAITITSGATFTYRIVEHPSRLVVVFASGSGLVEHEVARFAPNPDSTVAFTDATEPLLNDPRLTEGTALELATAYAEHLAESDDALLAF